MKHAAISRKVAPGPADPHSGYEKDRNSLHAKSHGYQSVDWRTRLVGIGGTASVFLLLAAASLIGWSFAQPETTTPQTLAVNMLPLATPPVPVQEVTEGPQQIEQTPQKQRERENLPPPDLIIPHTSSVPAPQPDSAASEAVPETTAPKSVPAPPANRISSNSAATWEAELLAHLERYRRYPAAARARREQGVAYVEFRMTRDGRLLSTRIVRSSGSVALDRAALDTLRRAQPLPAIPAERPAPLELAVPVEFFTRR